MIVSGNDAAYPVLGFSETDRFDFDMANPSLQKFMEDYKREIKYIVEHKISNDATIEYWQAIENPRPSLEKKTEDKVGPFITSKWGQGVPYNNYCPEDEDGPGGHALAGCVAIAMSQIMNYWQYPEQGNSEHSYNHTDYGDLYANFDTTYNWDNIMDRHYDWHADSLNNEVAQLIYHCAVAVEMYFGPEGSGAFSHDVPFAMTQYFGYSDDIKHIRKNSYSAENWIGILKNEMYEESPVYYSGASEDGSGGHAFLLNGYWNYEGKNYFSINWGWSGFSNGWFLVDDLTPDASSDFNYYNTAIIDIEPKGATAKFAAMPTVGVEPLEVAFEDQSNGEIDFWHWEFGDGDSSHAQNPVHTYMEDGVYDVTLTVTDTSGNQLRPKTYYNFITVTAADEIHGPLDADRILQDTVRVLDNVTVAETVTLTLAPGTRLEFDDMYQLKIFGRLIANGTAEEPVVMTIRDTTGFADLDDLDAGGWKGIFAQDKGDQTAAVELNHCRIEYVKNNNVLTFINQVNASLTDVSVINNYGAAIFNSKSGLKLNRVLIENTNILPAMALKTMAQGINSFSGSLEMRNSIIANNKGNSWGSLRVMGNDTRIINSTIFDNHYESPEYAAVNIEKTNDVQIINSILWNSGYNQVITDQSENITITKSNVKESYRRADNEQIDWTENISAFPQLNTADYSPYAWSPLVNAGTADTSGLDLSGTDFFGNERMIDNIDIGAVEFSGTPQDYAVDFTISANQGGTPLEITYADTTERSHRIWDIDNDGIDDGTENSVTRTFTQPGFYLSKMVTTVNNDSPVVAMEYVRVFNSPPQLLVGALDTLVLYEDVPDSSLNFYEIFMDPTDDEMIFDVQSENFSFIQSDSNMVLVPDENYFGQEDLLITARDSYDSTASLLLPVSVLPVNDAPVLINFPDSLNLVTESADSIKLNDFVEDVDNPLSDLDIRVENAKMVNTQLNTYGDEIYLVINSAAGIGKDTLTIIFDDSIDYVVHSMVVNVSAETGLEDEQMVISDYKLEQNYPNPFNPSTKINYAVPNAGPVVITVYDMLGNHVATLVDEYRNSGQYQITWHGKDMQGNAMPTGVYFYKMKAGDFTNMKKMLFIK